MFPINADVRSAEDEVLCRDAGPAHLGDATADSRLFLPPCRRKRRATKEREITQLSMLFRKGKVEHRTMAIQIIENTQVLANKHIQSKEKQTWHFHKRLPGYASTPLVEAPQLTRQM